MWRSRGRESRKARLRKRALHDEVSRVVCQWSKLGLSSSSVLLEQGSSGVDSTAVRSLRACVRILRVCWASSRGACSTRVLCLF